MEDLSRKISELLSDPHALERLDELSRRGRNRQVELFAPDKRVFAFRLLDLGAFDYADGSYWHKSGSEAFCLLVLRRAVKDKEKLGAVAKA